jgi:hypothetical protein
MESGSHAKSHAESSPVSLLVEGRTAESHAPVSVSHRIVLLFPADVAGKHSFHRMFNSGSTENAARAGVLVRNCSRAFSCSLQTQGISVFIATPELIA